MDFTWTTPCSVWSDSSMLLYVTLANIKSVKKKKKVSKNLTKNRYMAVEGEL